ncbi:MAG: hypothetical protein KGL48_06665 [Sphingomonadales bacterium]|nr:hypothetical protein [Sphingomonadales bacterium]MDE2568604.1 hypothetical protein [Sphingomonadales bacterium]
MRARIIALCIIGAAFASPALAREHFQIYEGNDAVQQGTGGTRLTKNGIDYWTSGTPPHRYKILGLMIDKRGIGGLAGDALGSPSVAKAVKDAGGDAVIMMGEQEKVRGTASSGFYNGGRGFGSAFAFGVPIGNRETAMQVVKYLPDEPAAGPAQSPAPKGS